jgi:hypothetical protein
MCSGEPAATAAAALALATRGGVGSTLLALGVGGLLAMMTLAVGQFNRPYRLDLNLTPFDLIDRSDL